MEPQRLNAHYARMTKAMAAQVLHLVGLLPEPPNVQFKDWRWLMHYPQKDVLLSLGMPTLGFLTTGKHGDDLPKCAETPWTLMDIPLLISPDVPVDQIQLWRNQTHVATIFNLALPPQFDERNTSNAETHTVR